MMLGSTKKTITRRTLRLASLVSRDDMGRFEWLRPRELRGLIRGSGSGEGDLGMMSSAWRSAG